jgi:hypothetical protein
MLTLIPAVNGDGLSEMLWKTTQRSEYEGPAARVSSKQHGVRQSTLAAKLVADCVNLL